MINLVLPRFQTVWILKLNCTIFAEIQLLKIKNFRFKYAIQHKLLLYFFSCYSIHSINYLRQILHSSIKSLFKKMKISPKCQHLSSKISKLWWKLSKESVHCLNEKLYLIFNDVNLFNEIILYPLIIHN
jgi:hypothetical protein